MSKETLCDFFLFLSTDKSTITHFNWFDFDWLLESQEIYKSVSNLPLKPPNPIWLKSLQLLWTDLLYFVYKNDKMFKINPKYESQITNKLCLLLKEKQQSDTNSYKSQHQRNIDLRKAQVKESKEILIKILREKELEFTIDPAMFISFFNKRSWKYKERVTRFMNQIKPIIEESEKRIEEDSKTMTIDYDWDKSNADNKSGLSGISNKEEGINNKEQFLEVWSKVKGNIIKEEPDEEDKDDVCERRERTGRETKQSKNRSFQKQQNKSIDLNDVVIEVTKTDSMNKTNVNSNTNTITDESKKNTPEKWEKKNSKVDKRLNAGEKGNSIEKQNSNDKGEGVNTNIKRKTRKRDKNECRCKCTIF